MKASHKRAVDELNEENRYPSYFRSYDFKMLMAFLGFVGIIAVVSLIGLVQLFKEWIDTNGQIIALIFVMVALFCFAMWALWIRKR